MTFSGLSSDSVVPPKTCSLHPHPTFFQPQDWHYSRFSYPRGHGMIASSSWSLVCLHLYAVERVWLESTGTVLHKAAFQNSLSLNALRWLRPCPSVVITCYKITYTSGMLFLEAQDMYGLDINKAYRVFKESGLRISRFDGVIDHEF